MMHSEIKLHRITDAAVLINEDGIITQANSQFEALSGWTEAELVGQSLQWLYAVSPGAEGTTRPDWISSPSDDDRLARTHRYRRRTGDWFWGETLSLPLGGDDGASQSCLHIVHDVSFDVRRTDGLTALITFVAEQSGDGDVDLVKFLELGCRYFELELGVFCNSDRDGDSIEAMGGNLALELSAEDVSADSRFAAILACEEVTIIIEQAVEPVAPSHVCQKETGLLTLLACPISSVRRRYGTLCFLARQSRLRSFDGQERQTLRFLAQWLATYKDAKLVGHSYAEASERLRKSEEHHRLIYEKTPAMLHSIDDQGRMASVSDAWLVTMGYERDEVIGRSSTDFLTPASKRFAEEVVLPAYRTLGQCEGIPYQFVTKGGDIRDIELSAISQNDDDGKFIRSLAILLDVTERKQVEQKLLKKTAALERSNADLQRFNHIASHDLQEPLRRIITYCQILKEDFGSELSEEAAEVAGIVQSGGRRLRLMINGLLAYVRVREQLDRRLEPVDMSAVLHHAVDDLNDEIVSKGVHINVTHLPLVWGRAPLFKMVFHQLLSNAIKHGSGQVPMIDISVDDAGDVWQFAVTDRGIGIEPRFASRIFEIFQRLHHKDECEGSGAGLAICQLIIQRCGGEIWLDRSYDRGARFFFTLPKDKPQAPEPVRTSPLAPRFEIDLART